MTVLSCLPSLFYYATGLGVWIILVCLVGTIPRFCDMGRIVSLYFVCLYALADCDFTVIISVLPHFHSCCFNEFKGHFSSLRGTLVVLVTL